MLLEKLQYFFARLSGTRFSSVDVHPASTIISNSGLAERIYQNLGLAYRSPTIGLWFDNRDYLEFIKDISCYTSCALEEVVSPQEDHPVGRLVPGDRLHQPVTLHFSGYASFAEAAEAWRSRCALMDYDRLFFLWEFANDQYDCSEYMSLFSALPGHTMALTHKPVPRLRSSCCIADPKTGEIQLSRFDYRSFLCHGRMNPPLPEKKMTPEQKAFLIQINELQWLRHLRARNKNMNPTILAGNCAPGFIYHNLGLQFNSPTINLWLHANDFFTLAAHLREYSDSVMEEVTDPELSYPIGRLIPSNPELPALTLYFQHYHSFEEARDKWFERYARINYDNLYIFQEFYNIEWPMDDFIEDFDNLPGKKVALLHKPDPRFSRSVSFTCGPKDGSEYPSGRIFEYDGITGKRYLDQFDYVSFLNENINEAKS